MVTKIVYKVCHIILVASRESVMMDLFHTFLNGLSISNVPFRKVFYPNLKIHTVIVVG